MKSHSDTLDLSDIAIHVDDSYYGDNDDKLIPTIGTLVRELGSTTTMRKYEANVDIYTYVKTLLKRNYFENKEKLIKEMRFLKPGTLRWEPLPDIKGKEDEKKKAELAFEESMQGLFTHDMLDLKMARMEERLRLVNKEAVTYDDIMIKLDQMLERVPESLRQVFDSDSVIDSIDSAGAIEYSQQDLLWRNFTKSHYLIRPKLVVVNDDGKEVTDERFMSEYVEEMGELYSSVVSYMGEGDVHLMVGREKPFDE
jgi:hypothetical protein